VVREFAFDKAFDHVRDLGRSLVFVSAADI